MREEAEKITARTSFPLCSSLRAAESILFISLHAY